MIKSYSDLIRHPKFEVRYEYLRLMSNVGVATFGFDRHINQMLYSSRRWRLLRDQIIVRDDGCDLAHKDFQIRSGIIVHHINPITIEDVEFERDCIFDPENLVCTSNYTHLAIHYGSSELLPKLPATRVQGDTRLW